MPVFVAIWRLQKKLFRVLELKINLELFIDLVYGALANRVAYFEQPYHIQPGEVSIVAPVEFVAPLREKSLLWHNIWDDCGRPHTGTVADIMRKTRSAYHYAVR